MCVSVILFADKFPKCQTLEDKMMFYKTWWTVEKKRRTKAKWRPKTATATVTASSSSSSKKKSEKRIKRRKMVFNKYQHVSRLLISPLLLLAVRTLSSLNIFLFCVSFFSPPVFVFVNLLRRQSFSLVFTFFYKNNNNNEDYYFIDKTAHDIEQWKIDFQLHSHNRHMAKFAYSMRNKAYFAKNLYKIS